MQSKTIFVVAVVLCGCLWALAPGRVSARMSFIQAVTELEQSVPVAHRMGLYRITKQIKAALHALPPSKLSPHNKQPMQDLLSCMAVYTHEHVKYFSYRGLSRRYFSWYHLDLRMRWYKNGIQSVFAQRKRLLRCLQAMQSKRRGHHLRPLLDRKYLTKELHSFSQALPQVVALFETIETLHKQYQCKGCKAKQLQSRAKNIPQWKRRAEGALLTMESIFLRLKRQRHSHAIPHKERVKVIQKLWSLRPVHIDGSKPISAFLPMILHISTSVTLLAIGGGIGVEDWDKPAGRTIQSVQSTWGMVGGGVGILAATPALLMIMQPQPTHANVTLTLIGGTLVPLLGASMLFSQQVETKAFGVGLLGSLPLQATWLLLGWINQHRWHTRQRQWTQPPPPPAVARRVVSLHTTSPN